MIKKIALPTLMVYLVGCGPAKEAQQADAQAESIDWHTGNVEAAFSLAEAEDKPLFFYWGAEWCPPCQEIKNTVFKHPKFISLSQLFVPVYLDGDTERAQLVGERFAVQGYPTMIIFNSAGKEITRIPGGIDTRRYLDVLSLSLDQGKQIDVVITQAQRDPTALTSDELTQLAFYSWWQDNLAIEQREALPILKSLAFLQRPADELALSRLLLTYLALQVDLERDDLNADEKAAVLTELQELLDSADTVLANIDLLSYYPAEIVTMLDLNEAEQRQLIATWEDSVQRQRDNPLLSKAERLATWLPPIHLFWLQNPEAEQLPPGLREGITDMVAEVNRETQGSERQSVINRAGNILRAAKMYPQAKELISAELAISSSPYYFMSSMAEIAEETGDGEAAVEWRRKAYQAATGKATRFQWGVEYVSTLVKYQPRQAQLISDTVNGLFNNLDQGSDVFTGRNYGRLNTLLDSLEQWQSHAQGETLASFVDELQALCDQTELESQPRQRCSQLLAAR